MSKSVGNNHNNNDDNVITTELDRFSHIIQFGVMICISGDNKDNKSITNIVRDGPIEAGYVTLMASNGAITDHG